MTHNEKRSNWLKEGLFGLSTGVLYGVTSVAVGHPFDTIKTKMQAQPGYHYGMLKSFSQVVRKEGLLGLYRGAAGPLAGSGLYRASQFAVFEALYTKWQHEPWATKALPHTAGLEPRVIVAGFIASTVRSLLECPIEVAKVRAQTNQTLAWRQLYTGFPMQLFRTSGVMVTYFIAIDSTRRHYPSAFDTPVGQFAVASCAATVGFWLVWPAEVLKNQIQAATPINPHHATGTTVTLSNRLAALVKNHGNVAGLYRGILPGTYRSFLSNGFSMVAMVWAQRKATEWGMRDDNTH